VIKQDILNTETLLSIGLIIATFGAALILRWRRPRRLWYRVSVCPLVRREHSSDKIVLLFDKQEVDNVYMCIIGLRYKGEPAIEKNAYESRRPFRRQRRPSLRAGPRLRPRLRLRSLPERRAKHAGVFCIPYPP
jgi:hypothetical protein